MRAMMGSGFAEDISMRLEQIKYGIAQGLYLFGPAFESAQDGEAVCESKDVVMLTSNNYLGLATHPEIKKAIKDAVGAEHVEQDCITEQRNCTKNLREDVRNISGRKMQLL